MKANLLLAGALRVVALSMATAFTASAGITLQHLGTHTHGPFNTAAAEIAAHDPGSQRLFVVNAQANTVDVLDISNPAAPTLVTTISAAAFGGAANSVAVHGGVVAVAIEANVKQDPGKVLFLDAASLAVLSSVQVGALPDMVTFSPDGRYVLTANEGEPNAAYTVDPEGSVSVIDLADGAAALTQDDVRTAGFVAFNGLNRNKAFGQEKIRIFGPNASVAQDVEPEYIAVSADSKTAWVTLQENNAIAIIDIPSATVKEIRGLGVKNHNRGNNGFGSSNALDASDRDTAINIANWPIRGFYLPDAVAAFQAGGQTYLVMANEGDAREYTGTPGFVEERRVGAATYPLDPVIFPNAASLKELPNLGRIQATITYGDEDGDGDYDEIYTLGARSFSIRGLDGQLLWDSGDQLEQITAAAYPTRFNASNSNNTFDARSPNKGPEPEGVVVGNAYGTQYAFVGLERIGGVMVYDLTNPVSPQFVEYMNRRNFDVAVNTPAAGDLGPEGLLFISAANSPNGHPLLVISNEISGTTSVFQVNQTP
jgi:DNA-binding beta-propeller fold protein YncE